MSGNETLTKKDKKKLKELERDAKAKKKEDEERMREEHLKEVKFESDLTQNTDVKSKNDINTVLKGNGALSINNLKKILRTITSRQVYQKAMIIITGIVGIAMIFGAFGIGIDLYAVRSANSGISPIVANFFYVQLFSFAFVIAAGVTAAAKEIDVIIGAGATFAVCWSLYFVLAVIMMNSETAIVFSSCPSMNPPGSALVAFAKAFNYGNFTFNPLDALNPLGIAGSPPGYYQPSDFEKLFYYTTTEIMCYTRKYIGFTWWLALAQIFIGFIMMVGLLIDFYYRHKLLNDLVSTIQTKYNSHTKEGEEYISIFGENHKHEA